MNTDTRRLLAAGLPAAVPWRERLRRLPQRAAAWASLPLIISVPDSVMVRSLEQEDLESLHNATDEGLILDDLLLPLLITGAVLLAIPLLLRFVLGLLPEKIAFWAGAVILGLALIVPVTLGYPWWVAALWVLAVVVMTVTGWAHLLAWTTRRALREIPESLARSLAFLPLLLVAFLFFFFNAELWQLAQAWNINQALVVALVLWAIGGVVCVATVRQHVREGLADMDQAQPLSVRLNVRWNAASVHLAQASIFGLVVFACFLVFGIVAVPPATVGAWTGAPAVLITLGPVSFSGALVKVSWVLGAFASLYMATTAAGDRERREEHLGPVMAEITGALGRSGRQAGQGDDPHTVR
ncbi:hypothetical protein [Corynebacterium sp.]|uniref:hypothetical protein n=1 Tax=Corynebacterium sp. TaxID=1720 RepID=UPI0026DEE6C6|nr:hypothetical protein [Corynebacterium sp.]MDO5513160.1 hypothetical protein [Corynebacterium sp.]